jgi:hypothetical protein
MQSQRDMVRASLMLPDKPADRHETTRNRRPEYPGVVVAKLAADLADPNFAPPVRWDAR